jgi:hypothetical protein
MAMTARSSTVLFLFSAAIFVLVMFVPRKHIAAHAGPKRPIVVELFTSEGCSSCPPADALLAKLEKEQPVEGAEIIVLGEHVDYWDRLGWRDRFSSHQFTQRQENYADRFRIDSAYTPQMIVAGAQEFNGADSSEAAEAIEKSEAHSFAIVTLSFNADRANVTVSGAPKNAEVYYAITETGLTNSVLRGENTGRTLMHTGVVRLLSSFGKVGAEGTFSGVFSVHPEKEWNRANLSAIVFVQKSGMREIVGAVRLPLPQ